MLSSGKISVCIPTYNGERTIKETMDSLLNQTYQNLEILILDDCSKDSTLSIIENYNDSRIKIIKNENNLGMVNNWNKCFQYATGKYILFLFQDDIIENDAIEKKVKYLEENSDVVMVFSATSVIDSNGKVKITRKNFPKSFISDGNKLIKKLFRTKNYFGEPSNVVYRKETCDKVGEFNIKLSYTPDWEYSLRFLKYGKIAYLDECLTYFRVSKTSMTNNLLKKSKRIFDDDNMFIKSIKEIYTNEISQKDIIIHKISTRIRTCMKIIFCFLFIK